MPKTIWHSPIEILRNSQIFDVGSVVNHILKLERRLPIILISFTRSSLAQDFGKFIEFHWTQSPDFRVFAHQHMEFDSTIDIM